MAKLTLKKPDKPAAPAPSPDVEAEAREELNAVQAAFKAKKRAEQAAFRDNTDSEYWVALCFQTRAQKEEFLAKIGVLSEGDKYLDGLMVAKAIGVTIDSPTPPKMRLTTKKRWNTLVMQPRVTTRRTTSH